MAGIAAGRTIRRKFDGKHIIPLDEIDLEAGPEFPAVVAQVEAEVTFE
jgi:hypothetical protein